MQTETISIPIKKKRIGIYSIVHIESGRTYIGSSKDIDSRLAAHIQRLARNVHTNHRLQRTYNRDGIEAFSFNYVQILEEYHREELFDLEDEYISTYVAKDLAYNIAMARGGRKYSTVEEREKASENYRRAQLSYVDSLTPEEIKEIFGRAHLGKPLSESRKKHLSDYWKGKPKSEETKQRMKHSQSNPSPEFDAKRRQNCSKTGKSNIGKIPKNAIQIVFNGELFQTIKHLAKHLNLCYGTFSQAIKHNRALSYLSDKFIKPESFYVIRISNT
jgi:group I intron endonuclease